MLLKSATILRCSELVVYSGIRASKEAKDLAESLHLLKVEKFSLEQENQKIISDLSESKKAAWLKDQYLEEKDHQLEESASRVSELEEANTKAFDEITKLNADIKFIEQ